MSIGIAGDKDASAPEHTFAPEAFNGWPLFGGSSAGHVPIAGPHDDTPLEVGIDIPSLLEELAPDQDGQGRLFIKLSRADGCEANGELYECAVRTYDEKGTLLSESPLEIKEGVSGKDAFKIETVIGGLKGA